MPPLDPPCQPTSTSTSCTNQVITKECHQCLTFLKNALNESGRTQSLLKALGCVTPISADATKNVNTKNEELYSPTPSGNGVILKLKQPATSSTSDNPVNFHSVQPTISLQKRFTTAASQLVGISNSTNTEVLTTSPSTNNGVGVVNRIDTRMPKETTITIECVECGSDTRAEAGARAYVKGPLPLSIILCSNRLSTQNEISQVLIHELIHVYDVFIRNMDLKQCNSLAYSEIRAAREAECATSLTNFTKNICVRDKASVATKNMFPEQGRKCVCDVFDLAIGDMSPLDYKCVNGGERSGGRSENDGGRVSENVRTSER